MAEQKVLLRMQLSDCVLCNKPVSATPRAPMLYRTWLDQRRRCINLNTHNSGAFCGLLCLACFREASLVIEDANQNRLQSTVKRILDQSTRAAMYPATRWGKAIAVPCDIKPGIARATHDVATSLLRKRKRADDDAPEEGFRILKAAKVAAEGRRNHRLPLLQAEGFVTVPQRGYLCGICDADLARQACLSRPPEVLPDAVLAFPWYLRFLDFAAQGFGDRRQLLCFVCFRDVVFAFREHVHPLATQIGLSICVACSVPIVQDEEVATISPVVLQRCAVKLAAPHQAGLKLRIKAVCRDCDKLQPAQRRPFKTNPAIRPFLVAMRQTRSEWASAKTPDSAMKRFALNGICDLQVVRIIADFAQPRSQKLAVRPWETAHQEIVY